MLNLKERTQTNKSASVLRIAPATLAPALPVRMVENASHSKPGTVWGVVRRALLKIAAGLAKSGNVVSGPPKSERGRIRYAANAFEIQKHLGIAASWPQLPSR